MRDGHFHLHYPSSRPSDVILRGLRKVDELKEKYNLDGIVGILTRENIPLLKEIQEKYNYIYPGLYVLVEDFNDEVLKEVKGFKFLKLQNWLSAPLLLPEKLEEIFNKAISEGIRKFQIHTSMLNQNQLDLLKRYILEEDAIFYLVHGLYAIYDPFSKVNKGELRRLEGNLFLGTSPFSGIIAEIPNERLNYALSDGLENLVVFESDFTLKHLDINPASYGSTIESVVKSIGWNDKILHENLEKFL